TLVKMIAGEAPPKANDRTMGDPWQPLVRQLDLHDRFSLSFLESLDRALKLPVDERWSDARDWRKAISPAERLKPEAQTSSGDRSAKNGDGDARISRRSRQFGLKRIFGLLVLLLLAGGGWLASHHVEMNAIPGIGKKREVRLTEEAFRRAQEQAELGENEAALKSLEAIPEGIREDPRIRELAEMLEKRIADAERKQAELAENRRKALGNFEVAENHRRGNRMIEAKQAYGKVLDSGTDEEDLKDRAREWTIKIDAMTCSLRVALQPSDAEILVNGASRDYTDGLIKDVPIGADIAIVVRKNGFREFRLSNLRFSGPGEFPLPPITLQAESGEISFKGRFNTVFEIKQVSNPRLAAESAVVPSNTKSGETLELPTGVYEIRAKRGSEEDGFWKIELLDTKKENCVVEVPGGWIVKRMKGVEYVDMESIRHFYSFSRASIDEGVLRLENSHVEARFRIGSKECLMNGTRFWLQKNVEMDDEAFFLSRIDLAKIVDPVLRPSFIRNAGTFRTVVLDPASGEESLLKG
ncbi:MAG: hypothetical protein KDN05_22050, partial [Verrucomicrobiae bacterium]|nr:hypothetical protein [Verrucomicrobiae bacterium]